VLSYFVPKYVSFSDLASIGLAHICDDPNRLVCRQVFGAPFDFALGSTETISEMRIGYFPNAQEIQSFGKFAIARDTSVTFQPESLRRSNSIQSHPWQDWSGNTWQIPIARRWVDGSGNPAVQCALPRFLSINDTGDWVYGGVLPKHEKLWVFVNKFIDDADKASEGVPEGEPYFIPMPSLDDVCDVVFGANYRVSKFEIAFLKTLMDSSCFEIMKLAKDDPGFEKLQKKTV
jgi:hypothetical protein